MRKMARVVRIEEVRPIPDADKISAYRVGGWWVVDQVGRYQVNDLAVYCEVDSWIPNQLAPFLSRGQEPREFSGVKGERLRTVKLKGQVSQGLLLPRHVALDKLGEIACGMDVTELLGIQKYEPPIPAQLAGEVRGVFPGFMPKTDQERIQNLTPEFAEWCQDGSLWEVTEKLDGSSMTVYAFEDDEGVCSRNLNLRESDANTLWRVARANDLIAKIRSTNRNLALQGELIGEGIQGNPYRLRGQEFYVFDIYDIDHQCYLASSERLALCKNLGIPHVPVMTYNLSLEGYTLDLLLEFADGRSYLNDNAAREGQVFKRLDGSTSFKVISNRFLLKTGG